MCERGRSATLGRWALVAVVLVLLVVPGRLLASKHASDDALVPYGPGTGSRSRAVPGETWVADAGVAAARADRIRVVEVRQAGTVLIEGYDVTYVDRGRRGTEHAGHRLRLRVA